MEKFELEEKIKSIRNRCDVCLILCRRDDIEHLLHTVLEDMICAADDIAFNYCAEEGQ